ncbi:AMP-binding protein [Novosphingobium taihuense]|uniref:Acyl-CoA synthetase (AMP-forming)/AMP-acid ligase II n=1 Tax=Novosphingobium taihuense TaxID=260085 RepID=A0A7W7AC75_9SPHN|nr:AMP-binding protein [Novosphingobium taihuense]MBB4614242.1 acyl-CoA synthetase (AMP-forming)/AMP-acid ligase II [Novosphingobium taihuense]TWH87089.1 acyl-CoA synthetase (AMP-forming)/AMP-acid ligase II [Novosphingobium taihuense]
MTDQSIYRRFQQSARIHADRIAIRTSSGDLSYSGLESASRDLGRALLALGIERGDRIAIWGVNSAQWTVAALGIQAAGGTLVPIGTRLRGREAEGILNDAGARIVFCDEQFGSFNFVEALLERNIPTLETIVILDGGSASEGKVISLDALRSKAAAVSEEALDQRIAQAAGDDIVDIIFTSGTTGKPKGVPMTSAQSLFACDVQRDEIAFLTPDDIFAVTYPFAHNAGYRAGWQVSVLNGVRVIPVSTFEPTDLLHMIEAEKLTFMPLAPPIAQAIIDHPDRSKIDLSSVRLVATGGTTIPVRQVEELRDVFGAGTVVQTGYGLTETAGSVTTTLPGDAPEIVARTVGRALKSLDVKIVGPDHQELPVGEVGEIAVRGPQVLKGYYKNPEATAAAFTADGFFLTGDAGWVDEHGNYSITDRIKDMYLVGGFNCYPAEIEGMIQGLPGVARVAVIGVDDQRLGQVGRAFIVKSPNADLTEESVIAWCRKEMANYKVPRSVRFIDALPLNATGKVAKVELRAMD